MSRSFLRILYPGKNFLYSASKWPAAQDSVTAMILLVFCPSAVVTSLRNGHLFLVSVISPLMLTKKRSAFPVSLLLLVGLLSSVESDLVLVLGCGDPWIGSVTSLL